MQYFQNVHMTVLSICITFSNVITYSSVITYISVISYIADIVNIKLMLACPDKKKKKKKKKYIYIYTTMLLHRAYMYITTVFSLPIKLQTLALLHTHCKLGEYQANASLVG